MTQISDTIRLADNSLAQGDLQITCPAFVTGDGEEIGATKLLIPLQNGVIDLQLRATDDAAPTGVYYTVRFALTKPGASYTQYWNVITSTDPVTVAQIALASPPPYPLTNLAISQLIGGMSKGDLIARTASGFTRVPLGANGQVLTADSSAATGVDWAPGGEPIPPLGGDLSGTIDDAIVETVGGVAAEVIAESLIVVANTLTTDCQDALGGTTGTPDAGNPFVTDQDPRNSDARTPTGAAGGDLDGTYPDPGVKQVAGLAAASVAGGAALASATLTTDVVAALQGTSLPPANDNRFVTGSDSRLRDSRAPSGAAGGVLAGNYPNPTFAYLRTTVRIYDDFLSGNGTSPTVGALNWTTSAGTTTMLAAEANAVGIIQRSTGTTQNTVAILQLRATSGAGICLVTDFFDITWKIRLPNQDGNTVVRVGISNGPDQAQPSSGFYFEKLAGDTNWFGCTTNSQVLGGKTRVDTGVAVDASFIVLRIRRIDAGTIAFSVNGGSELQSTTNIPVTGTMMPYAHIQNAAVNAARLLDADYCDCILTGYTR